MKTKNFFQFRENIYVKQILVSFILIFLLITVLTSQSLENIKTSIKELSSEKYYGRGYVNGGDTKAANWIAKQFELSDIEKFGDSYFQYFTFSTNTLPGILEVKLDDRILKPGYEYVIHKSAPTTTAHFSIINISNEQILDTMFLDSLSGTDVSGKAAAIDMWFIYNNYYDHKTEFHKMLTIPFPAMIYLNDKPMRWYAIYGLQVDQRVVIEMPFALLENSKKTLHVQVESEFLTDYQTQNVVAYLPGKTKPEEYIILCGHYDHLGMMGKNTYFPGADDNASGIAMILEFARFFKDQKNRPDCSVIFACFGAEETGLMGAYHFVEHIPVDTAKIQAVINMDMIAYGESGFNVENGFFLTDFMTTMRQIIKDHKLSIVIHEADVSQNSDHYPFIEKKLPAIFITSGIHESKDYHTVEDTYESLPFTKTEEFIILLREFVYSF